jgi:hypothetical protein
MKTSCCAILAQLTLSIVFVLTPKLVFGQDTTYTWVSTFGSNPDGFGGTIVMNSSSSPPSGNPRNDIVSITLSEFGEPDFHVAIPGDIDEFQSLTWTPTTLTPNMLLYDGGDGFEWALNPANIYTISPLNQDSPVDVGSWEVQTVVPEPQSLTLTSSGLIGLFAVRRLLVPNTTKIGC